MMRLMLLSFLSTATLFAVSTSNLHDGLRGFATHLIAAQLTSPPRRHILSVINQQDRVCSRRVRFKRTSSDHYS